MTEPEVKLSQSDNGTTQIVVENYDRCKEVLPLLLNLVKNKFEEVWEGTFKITYIYTPVRNVSIGRGMACGFSVMASSRACLNKRRWVGAADEEGTLFKYEFVPDYKDLPCEKRRRAADKFVTLSSDECALVESVIARYNQVILSRFIREWTPRLRPEDEDLDIRQWLEEQPEPELDLVAEIGEDATGATFTLEEMVDVCSRSFLRSLA